MSAQPKKRKSVILMLTLGLGLVAGVFLPLQDTQAYQVKRIIHYQATVGNGVETLTIDLNDPNGDSNPSDTLLGNPADPLDLSKSFVYATRYLVTSTDRTYTNCIVLLDDPTHVVISRFASANQNCVLYVDFAIVEFTSGVSVTSGMTTLSETAHTKVISLASPGFNLSRTFALVTDRAWKKDVNNDERNIFSIQFDSATQVRIRRGERAAKFNNDLAYQFVQFDRDINIQSNTKELTLASDTAAVANYDTSKAILLFSVKAGNNTDPSVVNGDTTDNDGNLAGVESRYAVRGELPGATQVSFTRVDGTNTVFIPWYLTEFKNNAYVKNGVNFTDVSPRNVALGDTFNLNRTVAFIFPSGGTAAAADELTSILMRASLTNETNLQLTRSATVAANVSWYAVEFPPLDVIAPENVTWYVGENKNISWDYASDIAGHTVSIDLCKSGCSNIANYTTHIDNVVLSSQRNITSATYAWQINNTVNTTANPINATWWVGITDTGLSSRNFDIANQKFEIKGIVNLTYPNGGNSWYLGKTYPINWTKNGHFNSTSLGTDSNFTIEISNNSGAVGSYVAIPGLVNLTQEDCHCNVSVDSCTINWTVPYTYSGQKYRIKVYSKYNSTEYTDESTGDFSIGGNVDLTYPDGGQVFTVGQKNITINWTKQGNYGATTFNLSLYENNTLYLVNTI